MIAIIGVIHGAGQNLFVLVSPELSTFLAAGVGLLALYPLSRWSRYDEEAPVTELPAMADDDDPEEFEEEPNWAWHWRRTGC